jgi:SUN domain-containing protein 1/2
MDVEQGLDSIPEVNEDDLNPDTPDTSYEHQYEQKQQRRSASRPPPSSRIGGPIGSVVYFITRAFKSTIYFFIQLLVTTLYTLGRVLGTIASTLWVRPAEWASNASPGARLILALVKYAGIAFIILGTWYVLQEPLMQYMPRMPSQPGYHPPTVPAANIAEFAVRLQRIENALASMSSDGEKARVRVDNESKSRLELVSRLGTLEGRMTTEGRKAMDAEAQFRKVAKDGLEAVRREVEKLQVQVQQQQRQGESEESGNDEEARVRLKALEERVGSVEDGVKDALDLGKKVSSGGGSNAGAAWWHKLASGSASKSGLTIKSNDGQDVTALIEELVTSAVSRHGKDSIARPDFALHSGGARIIPSLTSPTLEISPQRLHSQLIGLVTGHGYAIGRPPITALHHELHNGNCWPFSGTQGQLGVALAAPAYISDVTIDHVSPEEAFDMRNSAPREMELWGLVEGKDNTAKVNEWMGEKTRRREAAIDNEEEVEAEVEYPKTLPKSPQYVRVANFRYNVNAPNHIQTFPVSQEIRDLGVDFGVVVLRVLNNWGRDEFTCLYRMRVHGQRMGATTLPYPEELA